MLYNSNFQFKFLIYTDMTQYVVAMICICTHTFLDLRPGKAEVKSKTLCAYKNLYEYIMLALPI